eukprot:15449377-Alexandrium_andersonii.AAC.1
MPNPFARCLAGWKFEAVPGPVQLKFRTLEAMLHFPKSTGRNTLAVALRSGQSELGAQNPARL